MNHIMTKLFFTVVNVKKPVTTSILQFAISRIYDLAKSESVIRGVLFNHLSMKAPIIHHIIHHQDAHMGGLHIILS